MKQLREATALKDMPALTGLLARATEMGLVGEELDAAREVHKEISVKQTALRDLAGATQVHNSYLYLSCLLNVLIIISSYQLLSMITVAYTVRSSAWYAAAALHAECS
jgi:hypothetical protein